jgi:hypothetical protein
MPRSEHLRHDELDVPVWNDKQPRPTLRDPDDDMVNLSAASADRACTRSKLRGKTRRQQTIGILIVSPRAASVEFIDENGGGPDVRLRKRQAKKS